MAAAGAWLNHIARESSDVKRLAKFYEEILGLERIEARRFGELEVVWLRLPGGFALHLIERNPGSKLPEGPGRFAPAKEIGSHLSFAISNYDAFIGTLKTNEKITELNAILHGKGIEVHEITLANGTRKQAFFFDPDGNGLEVGTFETPQE